MHLTSVLVSFFFIFNIFNVFFLDLTCQTSDIANIFKDPAAGFLILLRTWFLNLAWGP